MLKRIAVLFQTQYFAESAVYVAVILCIFVQCQRLQGFFSPGIPNGNICRILSVKRWKHWQLLLDGKGMMGFIPWNY